MQARTLPALRGAYWLAASFRLYSRNPPLLTSLTLSYLLLVLLLNRLPYFGPILVPLILPALTVIIANVCRCIDQPIVLNFTTLTASLRHRRIDLFRLGLLHLLGALAVLAIDALFNGLDSANLAPPPGTADKISEIDLLWQMLRLFAFAFPVLLSFWFSPLLTAWNAVPALKSLFFSTVAAWRNWRAFAVFFLLAGLIGVVLPGLILMAMNLAFKGGAEIFSAMVRMVVMFVFTPVLMTSAYISYCDVFAEAIAGKPLPSNESGSDDGS